MGTRSDLLDDSIFHQCLFDSLAEDRSVIAIACVFQLPGVSFLVVDQSWIIVPLVEIFQNSGKNLGLFVGEIDSSGVAVEELASQRGFEEG